VCRKKYNDCASILKAINQSLIQKLKDEKEDGTLGAMEIALCIWDTKTLKMQFSGARRPVWILKADGSTVEVLKGSKKSIAGFTEVDQNYDLFHTQLEPNDTFYLFTDGYVDAFGGTEDKKLLAERFKSILMKSKDLPLQDQRDILNSYIEDWMMNTDSQVDDILVLGVRV
jgi:serine phosphatase RsbU (regulator of sigma subunit)